MHGAVQEYEGQYDWMLYGHDDTLFLVDSVMELLQDFEPSLPYIITGMEGSTHLQPKHTLVIPMSYPHCTPIISLSYPWHPSVICCLQKDTM